MSYTIGVKKSNEVQTEIFLSERHPHPTQQLAWNHPATFSISYSRKASKLQTESLVKSYGVKI